MARRWFSCLLAVAMLAAPCTAWLEGKLPAPSPVLRALLLACDDFVTQPDTTPSSYNNLVAIRRALLYDARGYRSIRVGVNQALDARGFAALADSAFAGAKDQDISLLYLSTHGIQQEGCDDFIALMSDGATERQLTGRELHAALQRIPGKKVVILDACYSGAAIGKGMDKPGVSSVFAGDDFKVLTSAGGLEPSFLWTDGEGTVQGGSFFAQALTEGISAEGRFAADTNRDGLVSLSELYRHQLRSYGASTPQVYPQEDSFALFAYSPGGQGNLRTVTDLLLETPVIRSAEEPLVFSYTLNREARLAYQLVYEAQGAWRFRQPQSIMESGRGDGLVLPGRKEATLRIQPGLGSLSGYLLLMIVTVQEDRARPQACVLMSVQTQAQRQQPVVDSASAFFPGRGEEAPFILRHEGAVAYTARVVNAQGEAVAHLAAGQMSRPIHLVREGTCLYWNGRLADGQPAPEGRYHLEVTLVSGEERYAVTSDWVSLRLEDNPR